MFQIGEFARLSRVSVKTLHHYDDIGLFAPAHVSPDTGYRYYRPDQLPRLNRILALRALGFALVDIARILDESLGPDELRGMLRLRRAQLERETREAEAKLAQVEIRLAEIEKEGQMSTTEVLTKQVDALTAVGSREVVPSAEAMRERCIALDAEARELLARGGFQTDGIPFALYYSTEDGIDVEMAYGVQPSGSPPPRGSKATVHVLRAATVAYSVYRGSYDDFSSVGQLHMDIMSWIDAQGYRVCGPCREIYLRPPEGPKDRIGVMEVQYPVERV